MVLAMPVRTSTIPHSDQDSRSLGAGSLRRYVSRVAHRLASRCSMSGPGGSCLAMVEGLSADAPWSRETIPSEKHCTVCLVRCQVIA